MAVERTEIFLKSLQMARLIAQRVANYNHRYKFSIGQRTTILCEEIIRYISQGYEHRNNDAKRKYYINAYDALCGLKVELILANSLDILFIEHKAEIDLLLIDVENQLKAVMNSLRNIKSSEAEYNR